jgi:hypothetical protein
VLLLTPLKVKKTLRKTTIAEKVNDFITRRSPDCLCPPLVIALAALRYQLQGIIVDTAGYSSDELWRIANETRVLNQDIRTAREQAEKLVVIGRSLLEASALTKPEVRSIQWMIYVVERAL